MSSSLLTLLAIVITDVIALSIGTFAWIRNARIGYARTFFLASIAGVFWATSNYYSYTTADLDVTVAATRLTSVGGFWLATTLLYFTLRFPNGEVPRKLVRYGILPFAMLGGIFAASELVTKRVEIIDGTVVITPGIGYLPYVILLISLCATVLYTLYRHYVHASLIARNQIRYVSLGFGVSAVAAITMNAILPIFNPSIGGAKVNLLIVAFFIMFVGYALIRNRYVDIHALGAKTLTYALSFIAITVVIGTGQHLLEPWLDDSSQLITAIVLIAAACTLFMQPARIRLETAINKLLRRDWYEPETTFRRVSEILASEQRLEPLLRSALALLCKELGVTGGAFILVDETKAIIAERNGTAETLSIGFEDLSRLESSNLVLLADDLRKGNARRNTMETHQLRMVARLVSGGKLVGYLVMGTKESGDIFTQQDVRVLSILSNQLAVAIVRSQGYEQISQFNNTLTRRIEEATHELREAHEKLQADDKMKSEFIMLTSHNLRTPLAIISGYTDMIGETNLDETQHKYFGAILGSLGKLKQLVDDLLTIATLEGGTEFVHKTVSASEVLEPLVDQMKAQLKDSPVRLSVIVDVGDAKLNANLLRIRAAIWNLLDNAFKFTKQGSIDFEARLENNMVQITITDTGVGIPSEELPGIFNKFHRASSTLQYDFDGEGIGLYLAKLIFDEHAGTIVVTSEPEKGTKVIVRLPLAADAPLSSTPIAQPTEQKILVS